MSRASMYARFQTAMEPGLDGPGGDVEDLGHVHEGQVEVEMEDDHGPLIDVEAVELASEPITLCDVSGWVGGSCRVRVGHRAHLDQGAAFLFARHLVAGAHGGAMEPGVPRCGIANGTDVTPGLHEGILEGVLRALRVAEDEVGGAIQARE